MNNLLLQYYGKFKLADGSLKDPENLVPFTQYIGVEFASSALAFTNNLVYYKETDPKVKKAHDENIELVENIKRISNNILNKSIELKKKEINSVDENVEFFFTLMDLRMVLLMILSALEKRRIKMDEINQLKDYCDIVQLLVVYFAAFSGEKKDLI